MLASMSSYCAYLGHQPHISLAELSAVLPECTPERKVGNATVFATYEELDGPALRKLGGTWLIAKQIGRSPQATLDAVPKMLADQCKGIRGKVTFSIRAENITPHELAGLYRSCKETLKKSGRPVRYVGNERKPAATALLRDEGLVDPEGDAGKHGCEIVILRDEEFLWVGRTVAAQDPDAYAKRDMEKPVRDTRAGMLPPKLAQVMLNFGKWLVRGARKDAVEPLIVLDPFCGTGVIPLESLHRRWHVLASDASTKAVQGCEKNIEWLRKEEKIGKTVALSAVSKHDATEPFDFSAVKERELRRGPDVVVTETHLGPALNDRPTVKDVQKWKAESEELESAFLENAKATLPGVPLALMLPVWYLRTGPVFLERVWATIEKLGFVPVLPPGAKASIHGRTSLLYRRPDQVVGREIVLLRAKA